ncbi:hypothetical protein Pfo_003580 [Paulownia fortunei]|nr:hypothetical protein Pfo_003580 [Paulownia fortunei]
MASNENRSGMTEDHGREPSKSREGNSWEYVMEDMCERLEIVEHNLDSMKENVQACLDADTLRDDRLTRLEAKVMDALQAMQISIETLWEDLAVCKKTATTGGASTSEVSPRVNYPKPNGFDGQRDAMEVENFLKHADIEQGSYWVDTWEDFKKELKRHFYPRNIIYEARKKLRELKQQGTIRKYVKDFTTIMLQIPNLSEEDLLFHFVDDVKLVDEAIAIAESLTEYQPHTDANPSRKEYEEKKHAFVPKGGCFVCKGPYAIAIVPSSGPWTSDIGSFRLLNALNAKPLPATSSKGLMYVEAYISEKPTRALVDMGATHNFIIEEEANRLGLRWSRGKGWLKTVNAKAQPLNGVVKNMELRLGTWKGQVVLDMDFLRKVTTIPMPSFSSVCILEKGAPCMIPTINPTEGHLQGTKAESRHLSAIQITKGVKWGEPTYLATLKEKVPTVTKEEDLPPIIQNVLKKKEDVMPDELLKKLPPRREVDHKIELEPEFDYMLEYKPGKANVVADALSRKVELAAQDPLAKELKKLAVEGKTKQFWVEDGLLYTKGRRLYLIKECHDTKWAGHPIQRRTMALLETAYFWPYMRDSVELYVKTCLVCQQDKVETKQLIGLLEPLLIPDRPWESITMDFIRALPKSC